MKVLTRLSLLGLFLLLITPAGLLAQEGEATEEPRPITFRDIPQERAEDGAFVLGSPDAPVTIVVFNDFLCAECLAYEQTVDEIIGYLVVPGLARLEYRLVPFADQNLSPLAAAVAECAGREGAFWPARDLLFNLASEGQLTTTAPSRVFGSLNLNFGIVSDCVPNAEQFFTDLQVARDMGLSRVPAVRVRVGDDGLLSDLFIDDVRYNAGPVSIDLLTEFVNSEDPAALALPSNRLLNERLLADSSLLETEGDCTTPCWRGIVPGLTTLDAAREIVEAEAGFTGLEETTFADNPAVVLGWSIEDGDTCCEVFSVDGETVSYVRLLLAPGMTLGELIEVQGEPEYVIGREVSSDQAIMSVIYPELLALVNVFVAGTEDGMLSESSEIIGVQYLTEEDLQSFISNAPLAAWDGYKSFAEYQAVDN